MKNIININIATCLVLFCLATGCTDDSATIRTLNFAGYTDITLTGYNVSNAAKTTKRIPGFRAKNPAGQWAEGTVCCGLIFKGCTIRF